MYQYRLLITRFFCLIAIDALHHYQYKINSKQLVIFKPLKKILDFSNNDYVEFQYWMNSSKHINRIIIVMVLCQNSRNLVIQEGLKRSGSLLPPGTRWSVKALRGLGCMGDWDSLWYLFNVYLTVLVTR